MSQLFRSSQSLYHVTNCCRMFVSSWLEKPKQIQHQSTEALNCDLFCQSCENKGCIKCPATTEGRSDSSAKEGECCRQRVCLHGDHHMDCSSFFVVVFLAPFLMLNLSVAEAGTLFLEGDHHEKSTTVFRLFQIVASFLPPETLFSLQILFFFFFFFNSGRQLKNRHSELSSSQVF